MGTISPEMAIKGRALEAMDGRDKGFYLGCAVWGYRGWVGSFYPPGSHARDWLRLYGERLSAVEGNTTFYAMPPIATLEKWAAQTSEDFRFCLKMPQAVTHQGRLVDRLPQARDFLQRIGILGERLGPTFLQLPPHYGPAYQRDLGEFLDRLREDWPFPLAVEVRHPQWFEPAYGYGLHLLLRQRQIATVTLDTRAIYTGAGDPQRNHPRRKPQVPVIFQTTSAISFVRWITHPEAVYNQFYLDQWVGQCDRWLRQGQTVYFFVHCPQEEHSPTTARRFYEAIAPRLSVTDRSLFAVPALDQLSLFSAFS